MEVIRVENLSKLYDLGQVGTGTLSKDLNRWWARVRGRQDPFALIGQTNDRTRSAGKDDSVWALKDISFSVDQGEVIGIIGRNGAGKSTLLKIISRITAPTTGSVKIKGRIASLLEVGTGFHPEMTGRENIFMNGTLLGMTRREILSRLDAIIDFAGVAMYIDTPVKRYSSGMQVRLGFAVAAFLEPEILIVDEVLAVGDAEFQKKAIGRMKEVSKGAGRTVLFVSHNMASVKSLCKTGLMLENGTIKMAGHIDNVVQTYLGGDTDQVNLRYVNYAKDGFALIKCGLRNTGSEYSGSILRDKEIELEFEYENNTNSEQTIYFNIQMKDEEGRFLITTLSQEYETLVVPGKNTAIMTIPAGFFNEGTFSIDLMILEKNKTGYKSYFQEQDILVFQILPEKRTIGTWMGQFPGSIRHAFEWSNK